jgi:hypothetical protein
MCKPGTFFFFFEIFARMVKGGNHILFLIRIQRLERIFVASFGASSISIVAALGIVMANYKNRASSDVWVLYLSSSQCLLFWILLWCISIYLQSIKIIITPPMIPPGTEAKDGR